MKPPWTRWALIASLMVNVLVAAAVIGALVTGGPGHRGPRGGGPPEIAALARGLDDETRGRLFDRLRSNPDLRDGRERMEAARGAVVAALRSEPFDRAGFEASMRAQRDAQAALAGSGIEILAGIVAELPAAERATLAERVSRTGRR
ncbi:periplasmic heavy metal sensor [uncultured Jannaschia sp.]|uniref:periplasmic heavy metal sensor n=1 Tax=uncultured Jannaschia sp. TaxID=293347 RepID=UPI0026303A5C|nr:periplasmic heavy metal sensor [uncultured Jannaschia sp.]